MSQQLEVETGSRQGHRRFVITNTVALNGGDAAILRAIVHLLRARFGRDTELHVFDSQPEVARRHYPDLTFHPHLALDRRGRIPRGVMKALHRARLLAAAGGGVASRLLPASAREGLQHWRHADAIISTGGTYLAEQYSLWDRLLDFELAETLGQRLVLYTQSIGAFERDPRAIRLARVFENAKLVLLRDERSLGHVVRMVGARREHWHVQPDVAFALADVERLRSASSRSLPERDASVLVSVRSWSHFRTRSAEEGSRCYRESIVALVSELVRRDARVTFLSTCQGIPEYWTDDSREATSIFELLSTDVRRRVSVDQDYHSPEALMELASRADLVVSTRLHMAILSLSAGTPVLPIAYEHKTQEVFAQLGEGAEVLDIDTLTAERALAHLRAYLDSLPTRRRQLFEGVERLRQGARSSVDLLEQVIGAARERVETPRARDSA